MTVEGNAPRRMNLPLLAATGCGLVLLGLKFWLIEKFGNNTPYWDQWDAEAAFLFQPWLDGTLSFGALLEAHNEHRILLTRLLSLLLLEANGLWSPLLEMAVNAVLHVVALGALVWTCAGPLRRPATGLLLALATLYAAVPFGWENTLAGFQSQFYFVLLFSVLAIRGLVVHRPFQAPWWGALALAGLAFFSLASGVLALAAVVAVLLARNLRPGAASRADLLAALLLAVLFVIGYKATPVLPQHAGLKAQDLFEFVAATIAALAWPGQGVVAALVRNLPVVALMVLLLRQRAPLDDRRWILFGLGAWVLAQALGLGYGRARLVLSSRYSDLYGVAVVVNAAALLALLEQATVRRRLLRLLAAGWVVSTVVSIAVPLRGEALLEDVNSKKLFSQRQEGHLATYLRDHDLEAMRKLPMYSLPYPSADRLATLVDSPRLRAILPGNLQLGFKPGKVQATGSFGREHLPAGTPPCGCEPWGSHVEGAAATGSVELHYERPPGLAGANRIAFLVAGDPERAGGLQLVQDGRSTPIPIGLAPPGRAWLPVVVDVAPGPFTLVATDTSPTAWLAIGQPSRIGRLDLPTQALLSGWFLPVLAGVALLLVVSLLAFWQRQDASAPQAA